MNNRPPETDGLDESEISALFDATAAQPEDASLKRMLAKAASVPAQVERDTRMPIRWPGWLRWLPATMAAAVFLTLAAQFFLAVRPPGDRPMTVTDAISPEIKLVHGPARSSAKTESPFPDEAAGEAEFLEEFDPFWADSEAAVFAPLEMLRLPESESDFAYLVVSQTELFEN